MVPPLLHAAALSPAEEKQTTATARTWVEGWRAQQRAVPRVADMLNQFGLTSAEGLALMCLAEALLRIPDAATAEALIADKLSGTHFDEHMAHDPHWLMNAASWALAMTGQVVAPIAQKPGDAVHGLLQKLGAPVVRQALRAAMGWMADQFVFGETIEAALGRGKKLGHAQHRFSYDMLGEGARTAADAEKFFADYRHAIQAVGRANAAHPHHAPSGISVKLSALHPRYEYSQHDRVQRELTEKLVALAEAAAQQNIFMVVDAEEADRQLLSLQVMEQCLHQANLGAWEGFGLAVQAYSKTAPLIIDAVNELSQQLNRRMLVRLIKGAYWDTEIKRAQERGLAGFPVYTRKPTTDVSYMACAKKLLACPNIKPVFGSHNARTIASILAVAPDHSRLEFQRLHGMGEEIDAVLHQKNIATCVYAPVGAHDVLLGYLVRRLLENGANSSFVHRLYDPSLPLEDLIKNPAAELAEYNSFSNPAVVLPAHIFGARQNSAGVDLSNPMVVAAMTQKISALAWPPHASSPPVAEAYARAQESFAAWNKRSIGERAECLNNLATLLEAHTPALLHLLMMEAHKTWPDAVADVREAVDFCRYYAAEAQDLFTPRTMPGITGEDNMWQVCGRGVFVCISPWNFPLAIFLGQAVAALVCGNVVLAKPAPQTPRIAHYAATLAQQAGIPAHVFQVIAGGAEVGQQLVALPKIAGVVFTGSCATAQNIAQQLAQKNGPLPVLIAETGGINAMVVDTSALPEQVVDDVLQSGFRSAGQRCSALRLLCLPHTTADKILTTLSGAMAELRLGPAHDLATDIGPVIDTAAKARLDQHIARLQQEAKLIYRCPAPQEGNFVPPQLWEISHIDGLRDEIFGPIVHVVRYAQHALPQVIDAINAKGFGLTFGIHSRIATTTRMAANAVHAGNIYINRSMIGAVVGSQPFGGHGLSGTGPKAGGPLYLTRFVAEKLISTNTTAAGGNASLLMRAG